MNQYFPNLQEVLYYDSIYALVLKEGNGSFGGKSAVAFLKKSELSMEEIKTIYVAIMKEGTGEISKDAFRLIMRLTALAQEGYPPSRKSLVNFANKPVNYAEMDGIAPFTPVNRSLHRFSVQLFKQMSKNGFIDASSAVKYMLEKEVTKDDLKRIWKFVDISNSMSINIDQWEIFVLLCAAVLQGTEYSDSMLLDVLSNQPESLDKAPSPVPQQDDPFDFLSFSTPAAPSNLQDTQSVEPSVEMNTPQQFQYQSIPSPSLPPQTMNDFSQFQPQYIPSPSMLPQQQVPPQNMNDYSQFQSQYMPSPSMLPQQQVPPQTMNQFQPQYMSSPSMLPQQQVPPQTMGDYSQFQSQYIPSPLFPQQPSEQQPEQQQISDIPQVPQSFPSFPSQPQDLPSFEPFQQPQESIPTPDTSMIPQENDVVQLPSQSSPVTESEQSLEQSLEQSPVQEPTPIQPQPSPTPSSQLPPSLPPLSQSFQPPSLPSFTSNSPPQPPSQPSSSPQLTEQDWIKKANILWARVSSHIMENLQEEQPSLKTLIRYLRSLNVDTDQLKSVVKLLFDEFGEITIVNQVVIKRLLVLLKKPSTKRSVPLYLCDIPILEGDNEFYEQAEDALLRIRKEIQQLQGNQPKRDFYETIHDLYEDLIKKSDFREIEQLQKYLDVLLVIRDKMAAHAPEEEIRSLQKSIPTPNEIKKQYTERGSIPNIVEKIKQRLALCDSKIAHYTMSLIPDDPLTYIEMNDLHSYLMLIKRIHYYTMIVELTCVVENQSIVKSWERIMNECEKVVDECKKWMDSVEEDVRMEVLTHSKTRELLTNVLYAVKIAERINECMIVVGNGNQDSYKKIIDDYRTCLEEYNQYQNDKDLCLTYEEMHFDYSTSNKCDLCLHHAESDREFVIHLGRYYHPECANLWIHSIDKVIPLYTTKEESMY